MTSAFYATAKLVIPLTTSALYSSSPLPLLRPTLCRHSSPTLISTSPADAWPEVLVSISTASSPTAATRAAAQQQPPSCSAVADNRHPATCAPSPAATTWLYSPPVAAVATSAASDRWRLGRIVTLLVVASVPAPAAAASAATVTVIVVVGGLQ
ncbi:hypothetical protein HK405_003982 [Cladochytrium tenue]|nr:hypothetical protein HK405_003982 [Cladochytrium tenue]